MTYEFEKNILKYNGEEIYKAPSEIIDCLTNKFNNTVIIVYHFSPLVPKTEGSFVFPPKLEDESLQRDINQNILCMDEQGNEVWRIEKTLDYPVGFIWIKDRNGEIWAHRADKHEYKLDWKTGKVLEHKPSI